jgi:hypothetical protein
LKIENENLRKVQKICFVAVIALLLCSLTVTGQEPVDSMTISKYTAIDTETVIDVFSDKMELSKIFPLDTLYTGHSPAKAAIMSAVVPGLGQIYNRKYWKVPVVYAAVGVSVGVFVKWQNKYNQYRRAYIDIKDGDPYTNYFDSMGFPPGYSQEQKLQIITKNKEMIRTWRDYSIVAMVVTYALNIIDANVDAHLMDFNLEDNISFNIRPTFFENNMDFKKIGLTLRFTF